MGWGVLPCTPAHKVVTPPSKYNLRMVLQPVAGPTAGSRGRYVKFKRLPVLRVLPISLAFSGYVAFNNLSPGPNGRTRVAKQCAPKISQLQPKVPPWIHGIDQRVDCFAPESSILVHLACHLLDSICARPPLLHNSVCVCQASAVATVSPSHFRTILFFFCIFSRFFFELGPQVVFFPRQLSCYSHPLWVRIFMNLLPCIW